MTCSQSTPKISSSLSFGQFVVADNLSVAKFPLLALALTSVAASSLNLIQCLQFFSSLNRPTLFDCIPQICTCIRYQNVAIGKNKTEFFIFGKMLVNIEKVLTKKQK